MDNFTLSISLLCSRKASVKRADRLGWKSSIADALSIHKRSNPAGKEKNWRISNSPRRVRKKESCKSSSCESSSSEDLVQKSCLMRTAVSTSLRRPGACGSTCDNGSTHYYHASRRVSYWCARTNFNDPGQDFARQPIPILFSATCTNTACRLLPVDADYFQTSFSSLPSLFLFPENPRPNSVVRLTGRAMLFARRQRV